MANQIIQSIKTIAQSLVDDAGYDKTRGGLIVGVNQVTNTYSVKIDGITYPIVRTVDDATYNIGDIVKVVIPCNQATQMYISASILSDNSLGNKVANATTLAGEAKQLGLDNQVEIQEVSKVADSKNKTFRQATEPVVGMSKGDIWIDIDDENKMYIYDGTQWVFSGGGDCQDGLNNATILLYQRGATAPDKPTADLTYTFATASLSPTSALNGWTQAIPAIDGNPCWVIAATASATTATDTIDVAEWSTQIKFVEDGAQGATGATGETGATGATGSAPEGIVEISIETISYPNQTATLRAILFVDGAVTAPTGYQWSYKKMVNNQPTIVNIQNETNATINITAASAEGGGLKATYNCAVTW